MKLKIKHKTEQQAPEVVESEATSMAKRAVHAMNVKSPHRPVGKDGQPLNPVLPADLTALSDVGLGRLFSEFATMAQWAQLHIAVRAVETAVSKRVEKVVRARVRLEKTGTVTDKEAKVEIDPRARQKSYETLVAEGTETLTQAFMDSYLIGRDACSREMSRRQSTMRDPGR